MLAVARQHKDAVQPYTNWDRARLSVVVPIGVIVAVAIVCIVVAVLSSAWRADEVASNQEIRLLTKALAYRGEWSLRKLENVAEANIAYRGEAQLDHAALERTIAPWLKMLLDHEFVLVADPSDRLVYSTLGDKSGELHRLDNMLPDLASTIAHLRRHSAAAELEGAMRLIDPDQSSAPERFDRAMFLQMFMGKPAMVAAIAIASPEQKRAASPDVALPIALAVKFIDANFLEDIASRLQLPNLRTAGLRDGEPTSDYVLKLADGRGQAIMRLAWTPKHPGSEIVDSTIPFIAVALAGFALLAAFVLRYMRRTANRGCGIWRCTTRCAGCPTGSSSASGLKR